MGKPKERHVSISGVDSFVSASALMDEKTTMGEDDNTEDKAPPQCE